MNNSVSYHLPQQDVLLHIVCTEVPTQAAFFFYKTTVPYIKMDYEEVIAMDASSRATVVTDLESGKS